jgi:hypothetical protein
MDVEQVRDRDDFLSFLSARRAELSDGGENWENIDLPAFLEAMEAWAKDWQGPFSNNPWQHVAALIQAGAFYE